MVAGRLCAFHPSEVVRVSLGVDQYLWQLISEGVPPLPWYLADKLLIISDLLETSLCKIFIAKGLVAKY